MRAEDRLGRAGEDLAVDYLTRLGMRVVDRNWRCDLGEIDIVAADGDQLVVCEVKTRSGGGFGSPLEAVTPEKLARLYRLAERWCHAHPDQVRRIRRLRRSRGTEPAGRARQGDRDRPVFRIDVVGVLDDGSGPRVIDHLDGVS